MKEGWGSKNKYKFKFKKQNDRMPARQATAKINVSLNGRGKKKKKLKNEKNKTKRNTKQRPNHSRIPFVRNSYCPYRVPLLSSAAAIPCVNANAFNHCTSVSERAEPNDSN
jgi:hypothetical protein